jgi:putative membrane protein
VVPYDLPGQRNKKISPLEILKSRYASGEISYEEFQEMKKYL